MTRYLARPSEGDASVTVRPRCFSVFLRRGRRRGVEALVSSQKKTTFSCRFTTSLLLSNSVAAPRRRRMAAGVSPASRVSFPT